MPRYAYICTACAHRFEQQQGLSEPALTACPLCAGLLRKEFGVAGVSFKGSGFYRTDSSKSGESKSGDSDKKSSSSES